MLKKLLKGAAHAVLPLVAAAVPSVITPSESSATRTLYYRLDDLLEHAEIDGLEPPIFSPAEVTLLEAAGAELYTAIVPLRGQGRAPSRLSSVESGVRLSGGTGSAWSLDCGGLPPHELGAVVMEVRSEGVRDLQLSFLTGGEDDAPTGIAAQFQQNIGQGPQAVQLRLEDGSDWQTVMVHSFEFALRPEASLEQFVVSFGLSAGGSKLELRAVRLLDERSAYAHAAVDRTMWRRDGRAARGLFLNTPIELTWTLDVPDAGRFRAGWDQLGGHDVNAVVTVNDGGGRDVLTEWSAGGESGFPSLDVDLSAYAGSPIELTLEVAEKAQSDVVFLLHPTVFGSSHRERHRDVLLYFCDTLRADALSCYGNERSTSPHLDAICAEGIRFRTCLSQGPWTYVSMPSALSSLTPSASGVRSFGDRLSEDVTTLAEAFREAGYWTAAFACNPLVGRMTGLDQGFDVFFEPRAVMDGENSWENANSPALTERALEWFDIAGDIPVLVFLHAVDPHAPYFPPDDWREPWLSDDATERFHEDMARANGGKATPVVVNTERGMARLGIDTKRFGLSGRALYDAEIAHFDHHLGQLIDALDERGRFDDLVFSFHSDHGEEFLEHGGTGHGQSLHRELIHVPWILHAPGLADPGSVFSRDVANLDLAPTLLSLAGVPIPADMQGRDLAPELRESPIASDTPLISERYDFFDLTGGEDPRGSFCLLTERWKVVIEPAVGASAFAESLDGEAAGRYSARVYDREADPEEENDVSADQPQLVAEMVGALKDYLREQRVIRERIGTASLSGISAADREVLKALGYLDDDSSAADEGVEDGSSER